MEGREGVRAADFQRSCRHIYASVSKRSMPRDICMQEPQYFDLTFLDWQQVFATCNAPVPT